MDFNILKKQVAANVEALSKNGQLFTVDVDKEKIKEAYLSGFSDPVEKQGHDCRCCLHWLKAFGGICGVKENKMISVWDGIKDSEFQQSVDNIRNYIHSLKINNVFLTDNVGCGTEKSFDPKLGITWSHFFFKAPREYVVNKNTIDTVKGDKRTTKEVFQRGLEELTTESIELVLELCQQGSLYRGAENTANLQAFLKLKKDYSKLSNEGKDNFCWVNAANSGAITRIRNTALGTLLINLSEGEDLDKAVTKYEKIMAPQNYRRPTALVTPKMVEAAKKELQELGLIEALERRFAEPRDLNAENLLFFHRESPLKDVFDAVAGETSVNPKTLSKVESISIADFIEKIVPTAKKIEVLLENNHLNNLVSLVTSDCPEKLFKWDNPFSWAYTGGFSDGIRERVKAAGGSVQGKLRCSLSWSNYDDLDIHVHSPGGEHVYFGNRRGAYCSLDIDANAGGGPTRTPVENIIWPNNVPNGKYQIHVNNYCKRETTNVGYDLQVEFQGETFDFSFDKNVDQRINFTIKDDIITFENGQESKAVTKQAFGLHTNSFYPVKALCISPNYWGENKVGNKHFFFFLEGAKNDTSPRGIFNEFLRPEFDKHRKTMELVGNKLPVGGDDELSGVGFSETVRNHVFLRITGKFSRTIKVLF